MQRFTKHLVAIAAGLALVVSSPALACPACAASAKAEAQCPMSMKGVERSATNLSNGVVMTLTAPDAASAKALQAAVAADANGAGCACPMHSKGVQRSITNTANGVKIQLTSGNADQVKQLQAFAAKNCGQCPMKGHAHGDAA